SENAQSRSRRRKTRNRRGRANRVGRNHHVLRGDERVYRSDRADRAYVVTANREFVAEEEALKDRNTVNKRKRVCVPHFCRRGETAHGSGDDTETKDLRMLRLLTPHREELRVRKRRLIGAYVASEPRNRKRC